MCEHAEQDSEADSPNDLVERAGYAVKVLQRYQREHDGS